MEPIRTGILGTEASLTCERGGADHVTVHGPDYEIKRSRTLDTVNLHENLARHLRDGEPLIITAEHALRVMQVLDAARRSGASSKSIDLDI